MAKKPAPEKLQRPLLDRLAALDDRLYLLRDAFHRLPTNLAYVKSIAVELRSLVCWSSRTEGLLWRLADELSISDEMELHVGSSVNRDHALAHGLMFWLLPIHRPGEGPPTANAEFCSLRRVFRQCEAIFIAQISDSIVTHERLILAVANQMGAHEDDGLDPTLVRLRNIVINNVESYVPVLAKDADLTLQIGERVLDHAERHVGFCRKHKPHDAGDVSLCIRFALRQYLAGRLQIVAFHSAISEALITFSAGPQSAVFSLCKRGEAVAELFALYPSEWQHDTDALFTFSYSSQHQQVRTLTNGRCNCEPTHCDFGWLDARELRPELQAGFGDFVSLRWVPLYGRLLTARECGELSDLSVDAREMRAPQKYTGVFPD